MMEKRNFVTSARTPAAGAADIDDILDAGATGFGRKAATKAENAFEKKASAEDEKSDNL
jgi:hypothetical protein